ncbi:unnamed protein product, partial [Ixodes pacificus]
THTHTHKVKHLYTKQKSLHCHALMWPRYGTCRDASLPSRMQLRKLLQKRRKEFRERSCTILSKHITFRSAFYGSRQLTKDRAWLCLRHLVVAPEPMSSRHWPVRKTKNQWQTKEGEHYRNKPRPAFLNLSVTIRSASSSASRAGVEL